MKLLTAVLSGCVLLTSSFLSAESTPKGCNCVDCKCTEESNCGCISQKVSSNANQACRCGKNCKCGN